MPDSDGEDDHFPGQDRSPDATQGVRTWVNAVPFRVIALTGFTCASDCSDRGCPSARMRRVGARMIHFDRIPPDVLSVN